MPITLFEIILKFKIIVKFKSHFKLILAEIGQITHYYLDRKPTFLLLTSLKCCKGKLRCFCVIMLIRNFQSADLLIVNSFPLKYIYA